MVTVVCELEGETRRRDNLRQFNIFTRQTFDWLLNFYCPSKAAGLVHEHNSEKENTKKNNNYFIFSENITIFIS